LLHLALAMQFYYAPLLALAFLSCSINVNKTQKAAEQEDNNTTLQVIDKPTNNPARKYSDVLKNMAACKNKYDCIIDSLVPYWYGTPWDYDGITEKPGEGKIACGYFVTTLVRDAGLPVQRAKMAQVVSAEMIANLCSKPIKRTQNIDELVRYISTFKHRTIFIIGLDNHTGFVTKDASGIHFIHSTVVTPAMVKSEPLTESLPITASKNYFIAPLRY
jgi:hypothetical protein